MILTRENRSNTLEIPRGAYMVPFSANAYRATNKEIFTHFHWSLYSINEPEELKRKKEKTGKIRNYL